MLDFDWIKNIYTKYMKRILLLNGPKLNLPKQNTVTNQVTSPVTSPVIRQVTSPVIRQVTIFFTKYPYYRVGI